MRRVRSHGPLVFSGLHLPRPLDVGRVPELLMSFYADHPVPGTTFAVRVVGDRLVVGGG